MGVRIYIWLPTDDNYGHASMTLSDGTHISWWPGVDKSRKNGRPYWKSVEPHTPQNYTEDVELEDGNDADKVYDIPSGKLDEAAIKVWWKQYAEKSKYHTVGNNCCSAVYEALNKGGATKYASFPWNPISNPENMKDYVEKLIKAIGTGSYSDEL